MFQPCFRCKRWRTRFLPKIPYFPISQITHINSRIAQRYYGRLLCRSCYEAVLKEITQEIMGNYEDRLREVLRGP